MKKSRSTSKRSDPNTATLSAQSKTLWTQILAEYDFGPAEKAILISGLQAHDRSDEAKRHLDKEGIVLEDRWGQCKPHPACTIERDSRSAFLAAMRALHLNVSGLEE